MLELFGKSTLYLNALLPCGHTYYWCTPLVAVLRTMGNRTLFSLFRDLLGYHARATWLIQVHELMTSFSAGLSRVAPIPYVRGICLEQLRDKTVELLFCPI